MKVLSKLGCTAYGLCGAKGKEKCEYLILFIRKKHQMNQKGASKMSHYFGKIQPSEEHKHTVKNPYVNVIVPFSWNLNVDIKDKETVIKLPEFIEVETVVNNIITGIIAPDFIDVHSFVCGKKVILIVPYSNVINITRNNGTIIIHIPNTTIIIPIRISIRLLSNSRIADGYILDSYIDYNSDDSGSDGKEFRLSA